ncbi:hypothetical protein EVAR_14039_1, partial [Eumeta japonica]
MSSYNDFTSDFRFRGAYILNPSFVLQRESKAANDRTTDMATEHEAGGITCSRKHKARKLTGIEIKIGNGTESKLRAKVKNGTKPEIKYGVWVKIKNTTGIRIRSSAAYVQDRDCGCGRDAPKQYWTSTETLRFKLLVLIKKIVSNFDPAVSDNVCRMSRNIGARNGISIPLELVHVTHALPCVSLYQYRAPSPPRPPARSSRYRDDYGRLGTITYIVT